MEWLVLLAFIVVVLPIILAIWMGALTARIGRFEERLAAIEEQVRAKVLPAKRAEVEEKSA